MGTTANTATYPASIFSVMPGNVYTADASDLRQGHLGRIWDDACDQGFQVTDPIGTLTFVVTSVVRDEREGEVVAWNYTCHEYPSISAYIWND